MSETNQDDQKNLDFPYEAYDMDGKLVLKHIKTGKVIEMDFDTNQNLPKNNQKKNIKNKIEKDTKMENEEKPEEKQEDDMEEKEEDMKTTKEGQAPEYESEERKKLLEEDENEMNPKKKKDMALAEVISSNNDLRAENEALKEKINDMLPFINRMRDEYKVKDTKDFEDLKQILLKEPYKVPEAKMEGKDLAWLREQKDFLDSLDFVQDFINKQPVSHEDVSKYMDFNTKIEDDPIEAIFSTAQNDFKTKHDFLGGAE